MNIDEVLPLLLSDNYIRRILCLMNRFCENDIFITISRDEKIFLAECISNDRVSYIVFKYHLHRNPPYNAEYRMEFDNTCRKIGSNPISEVIDAKIYPAESYSTKLDLNTIDKKLNLCLRVRPIELSGILHNIRHQSHSLKILLDKFKAWIILWDDSKIDVSHIVRPLNEINGYIEYPLKWILKAIEFAKNRSYVDIYFGLEKPMKLMLIETKKKKLFAYVAPILPED